MCGAVAPAACALGLKVKKGTGKSIGSPGDGEAAQEQRKADEVDELVDEHAEHGATAPSQGVFLPFLPSSLCAREYFVC